MTLRFVTVFPEGEAVHLVKDVGQIPYILARDYAYRASLVVESEDASLDAGMLAPQLSVERLPVRRRFAGVSTAALMYIAREAPRIDVLNVYHFCFQTKLLALLYRLRNRRGFIYVKLDLNIQHERAALSQPQTRGMLAVRARDWLHRHFFGAVNLLSAESREAISVFIDRFPQAADKIVQVANGLDLRDISVPTAKKENLIISVGRIGAYEKNHELLLDALAQCDLGEWQVAFVGPVTADFAEYFERWIENHPTKGGCVRLIGAVYDRKALLRWYDRAKVFVLTSRNEGYPLVFSEALCFGNFLISTDVSCVKEITLAERFGRIVDDNPAALAEAIEQFTVGPAATAELAEAIAHHGRSTHNWTGILETVSSRIKEHFNV